VAQAKPLAAIAAALLEASVPRAKSLIVTVFGDAVEPHGGEVWLGSLIALLKPFGLSERLVRTAVLRLVREHWLAATQIGRRSYYRLSESGRHRFEDAHRRIYAAEGGRWSGRWHLVHVGLDTLALPSRARVKAELIWQGFGTLAPNLLAHPSTDGAALDRLLRDLGVAGDVLVMEAESAAGTTASARAALVRRAWDLGGLARAYGDFLARFHAVAEALQGSTVLEPATAFLVRVLLIHEFRRVLLRDPLLPKELLPVGWPGLAARRLARALYRGTSEPAERHLMAVLETAEGRLPPAAPYFYARVGGLSRQQRVREHAAE
jgi:phenylacetic acid degradation operon negative regulatory protein